ncbi:MAG: hypothetical protein PVJ27_01940 [Candidatus Brocadiaceae bacterium]|jgi:hypothetical protein
MAIRVKCPNQQCGKVYTLKDELAGKKVRCTECRSVIEVPSAGDSGLALADDDEDLSLPDYHPARLTCTNCGAVLGVRDAICKNCGGDIRSGVTVMKITKEEKQRAGLFSWAKRKKGASRSTRRRRSPVVPVAIGVLILLLIGGAVFGVLHATGKLGGKPAGRAQANVEEVEGTSP